MSITDVSPVSVSSTEQEITVNAVINSLPSASYFRVAWQSENGGSYFGYVKDNSGSWVKITSSQNCANYYLVSDTNTSTLTLTTKIGDDNSPENGNYVLKIRRYTSTCGSYSDSDPYSLTVDLPTPLPTSTPTPTPEATSYKATYKINSPVDGDGTDLSSVQIYVDGSYIHHEDDEILYFYDGHECYSEVDCGLGTHTVSLRKFGYNSWEDTRDFTAGLNLEVNPILAILQTVTPSPSATPTPTPRSTPHKTASVSALLSASVSGVSSPSMVLGINNKSGEDLESGSSKKSFGKLILPVLIIASGLGFIGFSIFSIIRNAKKESSEIS